MKDLTLFRVPSFGMAAGVALGLFLAGCAQEYWIAPGVSQATLDADNHLCLGKSYERYPENKATDLIPVFGAASSAGRFEERRQFYIECMMAKGYRLLTEAERKSEPADPKFWLC